MSDENPFPPKPPASPPEEIQPDDKGKTPDNREELFHTRVMVRPDTLTGKADEAAPIPDSPPGEEEAKPSSIDFGQTRMAPSIAGEKSAAAQGPAQQPAPPDVTRIPEQAQPVSPPATEINVSPDPTATMISNFHHTEILGSAPDDNKTHVSAEPQTAVTTTTSEGFTITTIFPDLQASQPTQPPFSEPTLRYNIKKKLGEGGAGEVQLVQDRDIHRLVAVKRLKREHHKPDMVLRFVDEIRTVGELEHPNIVPIHDVGKDENGQYYFIMKYVEGESLFEVIEKLKQGNPEYHSKYTFQYRTSIFVEILKAMEFAHHKKIIHRDLKPANIMIGSHGEVMVMDWGIAKRLDKPESKTTSDSLLDKSLADVDKSDESSPLKERLIQTEAGVTIGTPAYMAPEQVQQEHGKITERTDIYNLCAMFYEFLTLRPYLRPKTSLRGYLDAIIKEKPKLAMLVRNKHQPSVPADLSHLLTKGLAKDPNLRYQSIREMLDLLQKIDEGYAPIQCPFTLTKRTTNSLVHLVNNHPMVGLMIFMLLVALSIIGVISVVSVFSQ